MYLMWCGSSVALGKNANEAVLPNIIFHQARQLLVGYVD